MSAALRNLCFRGQIGHQIFARRDGGCEERSPPSSKLDLDYAALQALVTDAQNELSILTPEAVNALASRDVIFKLGDRTLPFTAEGS
jgi:hypothetical protein